MYRFSLNGVPYPGMSSNVVLNEEPEEGRAFGHEKLGGAVVFTLDAYEAIVASTLGFEWEAKIEVLVGQGAWRTRWIGEFTKSDCVINEDDKFLSVTPEPVDHIGDLLKKMGTDYDFLKLGVSSKDIQYKTGAIWQIYELESSSIYNISNKGVFATPIENPVGSGATLAGFGFSSSPTVVWYVPGDQPESGSYNEGPGTSGNIGIKGQYQINWEFLSVGNIENLVTLTDTANGNTWEGIVENGVFPVTLIPTNGQGYDLQADHIWYFERFMTNEQSITVNGQTVATVAKPENDFTGLSTFNRILAGDNSVFDFLTRPLVTGFSGHANEGELGQFIESATYYAGEFFTEQPFQKAIFKNSWFICSFWVQQSTAFSDFVNSVQTPFFVNGYLFTDVVEKIASGIQTGVTFKDTEAYSRFLSGATDPIAGEGFTLFVVPKSNILNPNADKPATKAEISLNDLFGVLEGTLRMEWWMEADLKIRAEHIEFRENGGSYIVPTIGVDLNNFTRAKSGRTYTWKTNSYSYLKEQMPSEITRSWMDKQSSEFEGEPIILTSAYAEAGNNESHPMPRFSADIDHALTVPENYSEEGFFIVACDSSNAILLTDVPGIDAPVQNGLLSGPFLNYNYWRHRLPAKTAIINGNSEEAITVKRLKEQVVEIDNSIIIPDIALVKTGLDKFKPNKAAKKISKSENLDTGRLTMTLLHDTE